jgi:hypothetical protein
MSDIPKPPTFHETLDRIAPGGWFWPFLVVTAFVVHSFRRLFNNWKQMPLDRRWAYSFFAVLLTMVFIPEKYMDYTFWEKNSESLRNLGLLIAAIPGLLLLWSRTKSANIQADIAQKGHLTDRFSKAVELIGHTDLHVQIGGIYALEAIAEEDPKTYYRTIMELLCSFVRSKAPLNKNSETKNNKWAVQIALTAIGNPKAKKPDNCKVVLDLRETNLRGVFLRNAKLSGVYLNGSNLSGATFAHTNFNKAILIKANFNKATLSYTNFNNASVKDATFQKADISIASFATTFETIPFLNNYPLPIDHITQEQIQSACWDQKPEGLKFAVPDVKPCQEENVK